MMSFSSRPSGCPLGATGGNPVVGQITEWSAGWPQANPEAESSQRVRTPCVGTALVTEAGIDR